MFKYSYYPGCSLKGTAKEFEESALAVCRTLGVELVELPEWGCCGASSAHNTNRLLSVALPVRDLIQARREGMDVVVLCAACFSRLKTAQHEMARNEDLRRQVERVVGAAYAGGVRIRHLLDVLRDDVGLEEIRKRVRKDISGLKPAGYYGCLLVRPPEVLDFDDPEHPSIMDIVLDAAGVATRRWSYKTECCGGSLSITRPDIVRRLVDTLLDRADDAGANCLVTACPLCSANLEMRRGSGWKMPVFYFTELLGLAWGLEESRGWLDKHLVDPWPLLQKLGLA
ncbi:MAG: CoB--CoM heterodisulfide reductase iron-sulfur subunit B family protein [Deltaproteobacteria bacterium]|nr:CoB--CoM heterodisulfide reductase iron-sulfur subunit B family protein [Deltaproteobacteria bacterium]